MTANQAAHHESYLLNRHLFIVDNYQLLKSMDTASVALICTDPPFAKNETFVGGLKPSLAEEEIQKELETLRSWGIHNPAEAEQSHVVWPTGESTAKFKDVWSWESDVHEQWMNDIKDQRPRVLNIIETTRHTHSEGMAAYVAYMAVRLIECHRVLKPTGSLYLHCDHTANSYLRMLLDAIFDPSNFQNEFIWYYGGGGASKRRWGRKHDTILFYSKGDSWTFNADAVRVPHKWNRGQKRADGSERNYSKGKIADDVWQHHGVMPWATERTGYPTQKPVALAERILQASSNPRDVVFDPFAGCAYVPVAAERLSRQWMACDISPRALTVLRRQFKKFAYSVDGEISEGEMLSVADVAIGGPNQLPVRTTIEDDVASVKPLPQRKYKSHASIFTREDMFEYLLGLSEWRAWCCGFANWRVGRYGQPEIEHTTRNFELDHIDPKSKDGRHEIANRAPLCPYHNSMKSDRRIMLEDLRTEISKRDELLVPSVDDLVDLAWARDKAIDHLFAEKYRRFGPTLPGIG